MKLFVPYFMYKNLLQKYNACKQELADSKDTVRSNYVLIDAMNDRLSWHTSNMGFLKNEVDEANQRVKELEAQLIECNQRRVELIEQYDWLREKAAKAGVWG